MGHRVWGLAGKEDVGGVGGVGVVWRSIRVKNSSDSKGVFRNAICSGM